MSLSTSYRTHTCGELRAAHAGAEVALCGWVHAHRGHGSGLVFIDVRDRHGLTQVVADRDDSPAGAVEAAARLRNEDVIRVAGRVRVRDGRANPRIPTGEVEVVAQSIEVLAHTPTPPFLPSDEQNLPNEELRLRHRYLDLRRPRMQEILRSRHQVYQATRRYFDEQGFVEVETPILYKSTPEGAREFIVPSRHVPGSWYALPQSPQLFKQILMVGGCDRYMQVCRCFRDEDPRADRQAEFSQVDLEMSFVRREDVMALMEGYVRRLWGEVLGVAVPPVRRLSYRECMERYGTDRPDVRYGLEIADVSDLAGRTEFRVFRDALAQSPGARAFFSRKGVVKAIRVPAAGENLTRKALDGYSEFVKTFGAGGVPWVRVTQAGLEGGIAKFLEPVRAELSQRLSLAPGDIVLFAADAYAVATKAMGELRQRVARDVSLVPAWGKSWEFLWMIDPPMFERNADTGKWVALHHPFTAPREDQIRALLEAREGDDETVESIVSAGYDIVVNGSEIGGGSIRIHQPDVQARVFALLGLTPEQAQAKFSFLLEALALGAPPHGGIAFGLDRLVMHLCGTENIRDVIAFPKTQIGADPMTGAPAPVSDEQLREVHVRSTYTPPG